MIAGLGGNDVISGESDDAICGGSGMDEISGAGVARGGLDDDRLMGGAGDQVLFGGFGDDDIDTGVGNDRASGGDGDDTVTDGEADCTYVCGDDVLSGGPGDDNIAAGAGSDRALGLPEASTTEMESSPGPPVDPLDTYKNCEVVEVVPISLTDR